LSLEQYLGLFIDESKENLQVLNENLLKLEKEPANTEIMNEIFRVAHTFKGMAKTMGFNRISDLTHNMENLLEPLRSGVKKPNGKLVDILFSCLDKLENLVDSVIDKGTESEEINVDELVKDLQNAINSGDVGSTEATATIETLKPSSLPKLELNVYEQVLINEAASKNMGCKEISVCISNECVLPGVRSYMVNSVLEEMGEILKYLPPVEEIEAGNFLKTSEYNNVFKALLVTAESSEHIKDKLLDISEIASVEVIDVVMNQEKSEQVQEIKQSSQETKEETAKQPQENAESAEDLQAKKAISKLANQTIRVSASRLDKLMNLVGELVINKTRVFELSAGLDNQDLTNAAGFMESITTEIQEIVMKLRMVPIDQVFNRFPRLVRDISKNLNKDVNLIIQGKEIEIDRAVVDEIGDPLVHLIRNSLDHGLETPEERISNGKSPKGTIELSACNEGDNILIKITDDGRGIDADKVKKKAISKGLITEEAARSMTENEIYELVFKPGFSTVEVATDLSGRGVGMDVVKSKVNALNGIVQITSKVNVGTTVTITLPSTMAIIQALMIKIAEEIYALPLSYINEVIDVPSSEVKRIRNKEVLTVRGKTIPLLRLNELLEVPGYEENEDNLLTVVIVKCQDKYSGLCVSELIGQQEVVIKPINKNLCSAQYISGATTLGNGEVALILNINNLI
jgi:two-component system chemotaxis sensor kinase CheA